MIKNDNNMTKWDLATLADAIHLKEVSPVEVTREILKRIESVDHELNAFITVLRDEALSAAAQAEEEITSGHIKGPLHGIPIGMKDLIYTKGIKTTMGSEIFQDYIPKYDAAVVEKLKEAGAIIIGKLNTHQFAFGTTGDRSHFGAVKNPYDYSAISGGSSSGSGAAVSSFLSYAALGTDTGGSVRIPSSCCGIVGMKPTFGRVSTFGVFPLCRTLDHVGPMTRTVKDNAILLNALAGYDQRDPYSIQKDPEDFTRDLEKGIKGRVIGVPQSFYFDDVHHEVKTNSEQALEIFTGLGAHIKVIDIQKLEQISEAHKVTLLSEAYTLHKERLNNHADEWIEEVKDRLLSGSTIKVDEYVEAQQIKQLAIQEFNKVMEEVEVLITPTIPILPTKINQREVTINGIQKHVFSVLNRLAGPTNLNGFPSMSIPSGFSESGLPIGLQLIGRPWDEANLYRFAYAFEQERCLND